MNVQSRPFGLDWFGSALNGKESQNVSSGLTQLVEQEESRLMFAKALKHALANPIPHAPDRIALLHDDIRTLEKTLRLRLSMLPLDRPQAWFRTSPPMDKSPIASTSWHDPIFLAFEESHAQTVKKVLPELFAAKYIASKDYDPGFSLWGRLLKMNLKLHQLNHLPAPFTDIALEDMPDAIPDELLTPALAQYGAQLAARIKACQKDLEACYGYLWSRSESFLVALHVQHLARQSRSGIATPGSRKLSPLEEALKFMSFSRLPNIDDLRTRYRTMAQTMHPDLGGTEERFKLLSVHYQALLKQLQRF
ncbi:MAG: hypothetical protein EOP10_29665 [Proteobacteria bacterium]|nr:MAG: hypothetical protein EOP10_29665 [Pseudomonadota bacterium]